MKNIYGSKKPINSKMYNINDNRKLKYSKDKLNETLINQKHVTIMTIV